MYCGWKKDWEKTKEHFIDWWRGEGIVLELTGAAPAAAVRDGAEDPGQPDSVASFYTDPLWRARKNNFRLAKTTFPADNLPIADTNIGPGSLALLLGSEPGFTDQTVWFKPVMQHAEDPESLPPLRFDPDNTWWRIHEAVLKKCVEVAGDNYFVGCPDLVENVDILAALRDPQALLFDMIERPQWVEAKVKEINQVFFEAYSRVHDIIKKRDGSSAFSAFRLWGPGKTAKVQCDASAMFSPEMFQRFVTPSLEEQCRWLDYSMFHLDGTQCLPHLDHLLAIDALDAIEWTPQAGLPGGGSSRWYDIYNRILDAGKSVQAIHVRPEEVEGLLEETGGKGMYISVSGSDEEQIREVEELVESCR